MARIKIRINGTQKGMYLDEHREMVNKAVNKVIQVDEWDSNYYVASMIKGNFISGYSSPTPVLIAKEDCTIM